MILRVKCLKTFYKMRRSEIKSGAKTILERFEKKKPFHFELKEIRIYYWATDIMGMLRCSSEERQKKI